MDLNLAKIDEGILVSNNSDPSDEHASTSPEVMAEEASLDMVRSVAHWTPFSGDM